jgi:membrane protein required for colicin V production
MKTLDIIILIAIIWFAFKGLKAGFVGGIFSILALIIGGWATVHFTDYTCQYLHWNS